MVNYPARHQPFFRIGLLVALVIVGVFVVPEGSSAETRYFGNHNCRIKVKTFGGDQSGYPYAQTDVIDANGGCSVIGAAVRHGPDGGPYRTTYGPSGTMSTVTALRFGVQHQQGRGYWFDPERGVGGWSPWFG